MTQEDIAAYIGTLACGIAQITAGQLIDTNDDQVGVIALPGRPSTTTAGNNGVLVIEYPQVQVLARSKTSGTAQAALLVIYKALPQVVNRVLGIGTSRYLGFDPQQAPFQLGTRDDKARITWVVNFLVTKEV